MYIMRLRIGRGCQLDQYHEYEACNISLFLREYRSRYTWYMLTMLTWLAITTFKDPQHAQRPIQTTKTTLI